jgi:hypothetical protein
MRAIIILVVILLSSLLSKAQSIKKDTLYYFLDTLAVPAKDRLFSYEAENANIKWVTINCPCLDFGVKPEFRMVTTSQKIVDINWLQGHETVGLSYLLNYLRTKDNARLISNFDLFFIERNDALSLKINKVVFAGGKRKLSDDSVIVK